MLRLYPDRTETIVGVAEALRHGETTCVEVLRTCLARIDEHEADLHAWVVVDRDGAMRQAEELDRELRDHGPRGDLHGIPLGIKDIIDVAGLPTAAGFEPWKDRVAKVDAPVVQRLRDAGGVILGKTVSTQFACFDPPPTRNPWNAERTPGGSSSGSAAAVATGMCLGALGSQTGGSIIRPASYCGVCGLKPTYDLVPTDGVVPVSPALDHVGPIARCVLDLDIMLDVLRQRPAAWNDPLSPWSTPPRLGRLDGGFRSRVSPAMAAAFDRAMTALSGAGARGVKVEPPANWKETRGHLTYAKDPASRAAAIIDLGRPCDLEQMLRVHRVIMVTELMIEHGAGPEQHAQHYAPGVMSLIEEGASMPPGDYALAKYAAIDMRRGWTRVLDAADVLALPAAVDEAPPATTTGEPAMNAPWSLTGLPAVTVPMGVSANGLPMGIQLVGRPFAERNLLRVALWVEQVLRRMNASA